jgi:nucleoside-diphosphate-sugar epimerase
MRVLLTGATGALGRNLVRRLEREPDIQLFLPGRADLAQPEVCLAEARPQLVIHSAASGLRQPRPPFSEIAHFNVSMTLRLFEAAPEARFVLISSGLAYKPQGRPLTENDPLESLHPYGSTRAAADLLLRAAALATGRRLTVLRPFSFTGLDDGGGRLFPALLSAAARHEAFLLTAGQQVRDFCAVQDVAEAVVTATLSREPECQIEVFNIGSGVSATIRETVETVCQALGLTVDLHFGAHPYPPQEPMHLVADTARIRRELGWQARTELAYAVWQLARSQFPELEVRCPQ